MGPFVPSNQNQHIFGSGGLCFQLGGCICFSNQWCKSGDKVFEKEYFSRFRTPRVILNDKNSYFCNQSFEPLLAKHEVKHSVVAAYHPQTSGKVEISNRKFKRKSIKQYTRLVYDWMMHYGRIRQHTRHQLGYLHTVLSLVKHAIYLLR